ncbi:MAG TPA: GNAT family N-acetyltransferase [Candidatus Acidoferrum sp.]|nr:GNAT family N-acetyltransferase [Candidatus Acidoferrum sp.]
MGRLKTRREKLLDDRILVPEEIQIRSLHSLPEFDECVRLQQLTWGRDIVVPSAIFVVGEHTGGFTHGAFDGKRMVGFSMAVAGFRDGQPLLHSHMAAVLPEYQNRGVGRRLKLAQRDDALRKGIPLIEWTFDPLELKNAHFNFNRLGAIARAYIPDCYGITDSPLHAGLPTDRLVAEWWLDSPRVRALMDKNPSPAAPSPDLHAFRVSVPADISELRLSHPARAVEIQSAAREQFQMNFARGFVAFAVEKSPTTAEYLLAPAPSIPGLSLRPLTH